MRRGRHIRKAGIIPKVRQTGKVVVPPEPKVQEDIITNPSFEGENENNSIPGNNVEPTEKEYTLADLKGKSHKELNAIIEEKSFDVDGKLTIKNKAEAIYALL